jgi:DNA-binding MarR family transcriptional regulator
MAMHYGHLIRILHSCTDQSMSNALADMELTAAQGHIMGFLAHSKEPPCPRDIEEAFRLSHPTVSGLLSRLERKDFIVLRTDEADRRCKRIFILPKGRECLDTMYKTILANEERVVKDFTEEEKELFARLLERAIGNMGGNPCKRRHKEETDE